MNTLKLLKEDMIQRNSLAVQWLGLQALTAEGPGSVPGRGTRPFKPYIAARRKKEYQYSTVVPENRREHFSPHIWQHYCSDIKANLPKKLHLTSYLMLKRWDDFTLRLETAVTAMWNQHKDELSHQWNINENPNIKLVLTVS